MIIDNNNNIINSRTIKVLHKINKTENIWIYLNGLLSIENIDINVNNDFYITISSLLDINLFDFKITVIYEKI